MNEFREVAATKIHGKDTLDVSDSIYSGVVSTTEQIIPVPSGAYVALFNSTGDLYVNYDTTVALPVGTVSLAGGELNPYPLRFVGDTTNLHLIAPSSISVTIAFYGE